MITALLSPKVLFIDIYDLKRLFEEGIKYHWYGTEIYACLMIALHYFGILEVESYYDAWQRDTPVWVKHMR